MPFQTAGEVEEALTRVNIVKLHCHLFI